MKGMANILVVLALLCYIFAIISKLTNTGLYDFGVKPVSALVFGNSCLLLALAVNTFKK
jgi:hypothetical protein